MFKRYIHEISGLARATDTKTVLAYIMATAQVAPQIIRTRNLAAADRCMHGPIKFRTWVDSITIDCSEVDRNHPFDESSSFGLAREIYGRNVYLRPFRQFHAMDKAAIDLGGNRGLVTALIANALMPDTILYVEPDERYRSSMLALTSRYRSQVKIVHGFVGAAPRDSKPLDIETIAPGGRIAFLKADIEGAEESLFREAGQWLDRVERIAMEAHPQLCSVANVVHDLERRGFYTLTTDAMGRRTGPAEAMFVYAVRSVDEFA